MQATDSETRRYSLYRAVWRWHFYAGLLVLPFLLLLAVTGGAYLFHNEISAYVYHDWRTVEALEQPMLPPSVLVRKASAGMPGEVTRITLPDSPTSAARVVTRASGGGSTRSFTGYINPYTGGVIGFTSLGGIMEVIRNIHSLERFGFLANCLIEIVAGWCLILIATGVYLWWPRRQSGGVVSVRGAPGERVFWRDLHAVVGAFAAVVIGFMALTGMPWSAVWGSQLHRLVAEAGLGRPPVPESSVPVTTHAEHLGETGWTLDPMPVPRSHTMRPEPIGIDKAVAIFNRLGMHEGYRVALPGRPHGVYSATWSQPGSTRTRTIHLNQYTGTVLADINFADFGIGSQAIAWVVSVHMGDQYGRINQAVMLFGCISVILLAVSSAVMWWKRRPRGSLGVPPAPQDRRALRVVTAILAIGGIIFPLVGLTILAALVLDWLAQLIRRYLVRRRAAAV